MPNPNSGYQDEWARLRDHRHAVLRHLKETGPVPLDILYSQFKQHKVGEIGAALRHLAYWKDITLEEHIVTITASGVLRLTTHPDRPQSS